MKAHSLLAVFALSAAAAVSTTGCYSGSMSKSSNQGALSSFPFGYSLDKSIDGPAELSQTLLVLKDMGINNYGDTGTLKKIDSIRYATDPRRDIQIPGLDEPYRLNNVWDQSYNIEHASDSSEFSFEEALSFLADSTNGEEYVTDVESQVVDVYQATNTAGQTVTMMWRQDKYGSEILYHVCDGEGHFQEWITDMGDMVMLGNDGDPTPQQQFLVAPQVQP